MSSLSPQSRDLIDAARDGDALADDDRRRMRKAILAQVGVGAATAATAATAKAATAATAKAATATAATTATATTAAATGGTLSLIKLGVGAALVSALGLGALSMATSDATPADVTPADATPAATVPETSSPEPRAATAATSDEPSTGSDPKIDAEIEPSPKAPAKPRAKAKRTLAEETALLQRAQAEIQAGNNEAALELLDEHQGSYARGAMAEEREAARVLALCGSGRTDEGRAAAATFVARYPRSPHKSRVQAACP